MAKNVLVTKTTSSNLGSQAANPSLLSDGDLGLYNGNTAAVIPASSYTGGVAPFFYAQGVPAGRNPRLSPIIKAGAVKSITKKGYTVPVQPVMVVGYQGTGSNNINFLAASGSQTVSYGIKIENLITLAPPFPKAYAQYTLRNGTLAYNNPVWVVDQLAKDLNEQLSVLPTIDGGQFALVDVLSDLALTTTAATGTSVTYTVTNNSNIITIVAGSGNVTVDASLAAAKWVRIGGSATTNPIYQIANVSGGGTPTVTVTLTRPFVGTTATGVAIANLKVDSNVPGTSSLAGLKISVIGSYFSSNNYAAGKLNMMVNVPLLDQLAGTPEFVSTAMVYGSGTYNEVLKKEMQALGDIGVENRIWMPLPNDTYAVPGTGYIGYSIYYENPVSDKSAQGQGRVEPGMLDIYIVDSTTVTNFDIVLAAISGVTIS